MTTKTIIINDNGRYRLEHSRIDYSCVQKNSFYQDEPIFTYLRSRPTRKAVLSISDRKRDGFKKLIVKNITPGYHTETWKHGVDLPCPRYLSKLAGWKVKEGDVLYIKLEGIKE